MAAPNRFRMLDPTYEKFTRGLSRKNTRSLAPAPGSMKQLRVGLLANGKTNSRELLEELFAELGRTPGISVTASLPVMKPSVSVPPHQADLERLIRDTDVVITAIGD